MKMNIDLQLGQEELEKKKKFFEDQQNINSKLERDIDSLDQAISELSVKLTKEDTNRLQFQDEVCFYLSIIKIRDFLLFLKLFKAYIMKLNTLNQVLLLKLIIIF